VMGSVAQSDIGMASGTFNTMRQLGGVFGVAALVAVFSAKGSYASPSSFAVGFRYAIGISAALSLVGAITAAMLSASRPTTGISTTTSSAVLAEAPR
jgi:hypothetical protein